MRTIKRSAESDPRIALFKEHSARVADLYAALNAKAITEEQFEAMRNLSLEFCNSELRKLGLCK